MARSPGSASPRRAAGTTGGIGTPETTGTTAPGPGSQVETGSLAAFGSRVDLPAFRRRLLAWFRKYGRTLPWRVDSDPYHVWLSEIMLQQTTVTAVKPYYERFLRRFPTVQALADADLADVLRSWEGLGYYSRARNLHAAARKIVTELDGVAPTDVAGWQSLPGIGRYTAGAIVSFAFNRPAAIVEANTLRLYSRLLGFDGDPRSKLGQELLWSFAEAILPAKSARDFNSAVMDLGSQVCTLADPKCGECPLRADCAAFVAGRQAEIPQPARRPGITNVDEVCIAVRNADGDHLLVQNAAGGRWAGLWDFVRFPMEPAPSASPAGLRSLLSAVHREFGLAVDRIEPLTVLKHGVTRYRITLHVFTASFRTGEPIAPHVAAHRWVTLKQLKETPLSTTGRQVAKLLEQRTLFDGPARDRRV